jgi:guanine nucleotide-binding protein G(I)/G(S)/G(T) subunit beta-1
MADLEAAKQEANNLKNQIKQNAAQKTGTTLAQAASGTPALANMSGRIRRTLKGHLAKIYAMQWAQESPTLASASQDGKLIVWNAVTCLKMNAITLPSNWVMTCGYSPDGEFVASGGLDNNCSVWKLRGTQTPNKVSRELTGHDGFLSCCRFLDNRQILTSSGDHTSVLWDIETAHQVQVFRQHTGDVMFVALNNDKKQFVSASCDSTIVAWDIRQPKPTHIFPQHESDVNVVQFFPNDTTFGSGSEDGTCRLFDLRCFGEINRYSVEAKDPQAPPVPTSIAFSASGRLLYASYTDNSILIWDTLKAERKGTIPSHEKRVSSLGVSGEGSALCTASWDSLLKIWT